MKIWIVLPALNESENLEDLHLQISSVMAAINANYRIIVVNDGSTDGTRVLLKGLKNLYPLTVIDHKRNRGLGESIRDGFEKVAEMAAPQDVLIRMDADLTHDPVYIPHLLKAVESGADIAVASRFVPGGSEKGTPKNRRWISTFANQIFRTFFPIGGVREYTCGFRAYKMWTIQEALNFYGNDFLQLRGLGFCCTVEKLVKLNLIGAKVVEVPFTLRYDKKRGDSKMSFNVTTFGYFIMLILYHWPINGWRVTARVTLSSKNDSKS